jgi:hypothetical protein
MFFGRAQQGFPWLARGVAAWLLRLYGSNQTTDPGFAKSRVSLAQHYL